MSGAAAGRDRGADGHWSERRSSHFVLYQDVDIDRYSGPDGSRRFERDVLGVLEDAFDAVGERLGIRPRTAVRAVVYDAAVFDARYAPLFRFRAAGFFDGALHVRSGTRVDTALVATLHHEYLHAALAAVAPPDLFPGWLNEGLAEWFERLALGRRHLSPGEDAALRRAVAAGRWIPLDQLAAPSFAGLSAESAEQAYLESYAAVEWIARRHGERALARLCDQLVRTRSLDRALQRSVRGDLADVEAGVLAELG